MLEAAAIRDSLLADLSTDLPHAVRLQRLVSAVREYFDCGAVALLELEGDSLRPLAVEGLVPEALGRRFVVAQHPRLAAILARREPTRFEPDADLPDPYDGLLDSKVGEPLPVHDCMGSSLYVEGRLWGALTLDALRSGTFGRQAREALQGCARLVEAALRVTRLEEEMRGLRLSRAGNASADGAVLLEADEIVGRSEPLEQLLHEIDVIADSELPVLLLGETGVGKELFARRLHTRSRRRDKALVHVNCAALPESLAESELFGHLKGAFSGAHAERPGRFEAADGGTLFLDEVGELPLPVQAKLLRTLQNGEIQRLGADRPRRVDVRLIAATNRNLREAVRNGVFRADLYHRLSVYPVPIPPLRERGDDVLLLAGRFLELNRARLGLRSLRLSLDAGEALRRYAWPGNVRELEHVISRAALKALSRGAARGEIVTLDAKLLDLDLDLDGDPELEPRAGLVDARAGVLVERALAERALAERALAERTGAGVDMSARTKTQTQTGVQAELPSAPRGLREATEACQRELIAKALAACSGNWTQAARRLGLDASNLHKLARRLGIK